MRPPAEARPDDEPKRTTRRDLPVETHAELLRLATVANSSSEQAANARAELRAAIRKAHKDGGSIRAIAIAAALSTTRVGVIVNETEREAK